MTNKELIKGWKTLSIKFKTTGEIRPMTDMFLLCWGCTQMDVEGKKEETVVFDQGGTQGSQVLFCQSDKDDACWAFGWNEEKKTSIKTNIGQFIKN